MPRASLYAMHKGLRSVGVDNQTVTLFGTLMDSKTLFLTPNTETVYLVGWLDLRDGPMVVETPPNILGFEEVNHLVQEEPNDALDPEILGLLAAISIEKGTPFAPDERMKKIPTDAAAVGNATSRAIL